MPQLLGPLAVVLAALLLALAVRRYVVFVTRVRSWSMHPTLRPGQWLWVRRVRRADQLRRGDIVVVDSAEVGRVIVKRAVGLPGDRVRIGPDGRVRLDDVAVDEPHAQVVPGTDRTYEVPAGHLLLLGDNRAHSSDSRAWRQPYVPVSSVLGRTGRRAAGLRHSSRR